MNEILSISYYGGIFIQHFKDLIQGYSCKWKQFENMVHIASVV